MTVVEPAVTTAPARVVARHGRWRMAWPSWAPKTVIVTAGVTLATAWVFPALTHQWQDRQKARELSAGLVTRISRQTSQALVTSQFFSSGRNPFLVEHQFNQKLFNQLDLGWRDASAEIAGELQAYYSPAVLDRWETYRRLVQRTYFLATLNTSRRAATIRMLREHFGDTNWKRWQGDLLRKPWVEHAGANAAVKAYLRVSGALLGESSKIDDAVLHDHPAGFSTQPIDIVHDLLP